MSLFYHLDGFSCVGAKKSPRKIFRNFALAPAEYYWVVAFGPPELDTDDGKAGRSQKADHLFGIVLKPCGLSDVALAQQPVVGVIAV